MKVQLHKQRWNRYRVLLVLGAVALFAMLNASSAAAVSDGEELFTLTPPVGSSAGEAYVATDIATDPVTGHLFLADAANHRIDEYTPWGSFVKAFGWDVSPGAVNEQQEVRIRAATGQFQLRFEGTATPDISLETTVKGPQAAGVIEKALNELPSIGGAGGSVSVTANQGTPDGSTPYIYVITFKGSLAGKNVGQLEIEPGALPLAGGQPSTLAEVITRAAGGGSSAELESCTEESGCQQGLAGGGAGELTNPASIWVNKAGEIFVADRETYRVQVFNRAGEFLRTFGGDVVSDGAAGTGDLAGGSKQVTGLDTTSKFFEVGQTVLASGLPAGTKIVAVGPGTLTLSQAATETVGGTSIEAPEGFGNVQANERQTFAIGKGADGLDATGGTFTITFHTPDPSPSRATTSGIPIDASPAEVETALAALPNLASGDLAVTGAAGGPWTVEFVGPRFGDSAPPRLSIGTSELVPYQSINYEYNIQFGMTTAPEVCVRADSCRAGVQGQQLGEFSGGSSWYSAAGSEELAGGYDYGSGLTETSAGIFVGDNQRIERFDVDGEAEMEVPLPGEIPYAIAPSASENLLTYLYEAKLEGKTTPAVVELDAVSGTEVGKIPLGTESVEALASDSAGNIYAGHGGQNSFYPDFVDQFDSQFAPLSPPQCCTAPLVAEPEEPEERLFPLHVSSLATNSANDLVVGYYGEYSHGQPKNTFKVFGPGPVSLEAPPAVPPTIVAQSTSSVTSTEATVTGLINPHFWTDTHFYVEYGTGKCSTGGCTAKKPVPPGALLTSVVRGNAVKVPGVILEGLQPNTTYNFRLVSEGGGGGPVAGIGGSPGTPGSEGTFTTTGTAAGGGGLACANSAFRTSFSALLPDCRAFEMVSPLEKQGGDVKTLINAFSYSNALDQSALEGGAFTFSSFRAFEGSPGAPQTSQYMAVRHEGEGWITASITPRQSLDGAGSGYNTGVNWDNEFRAFSPDLCQAWLLVGVEPALAPGVEPGNPALYKRQNCGSGEEYEALAQAIPPRGLGEVELLGTSAAGDAAVVRSELPLNPSEPSRPGTSRSYYLSRGQAYPLCVLPNGREVTGNCSAGTTPNRTGVLAEGEGNRVGTVTHAISANGSMVYWTQVTEQSGPTGAGQIYLRENPAAEESPSGGCEEGRACTIKVSGTKSPAESRFLAASADGSRAIFEVIQGPLAGTICEFDAETESSRVIARNSRGYVGGAEDLSIFYFVSEEAIAGTEGATRGQPNLYVEQEETPKFVATLSELDANRKPQALSDVSPQAVFHIARATPDGRTLAFMSTNPLTGYDNTDATSQTRCGLREGSNEGICDSEVFLYRVDGELLVCVSCNPTGALPEGRAGLKVGESTLQYTVAGSLTAPTTQFNMPRNLSDDGQRVFFDSYGPLVSRDTNGKEDVYEWEAAGSAAECEAVGAEAYAPASHGCLSLISTGETSSDSEFLDADGSGDNAFIDTNASLLPQDPGLYDVYDARVDGGFAQPTGTAACEGEACQGPFSPPDDATPASANYNGPGNVKAAKATPKKKHKKQKHKKHKKNKGKKKSGKAGKKGKNKKSGRNRRNG